MSSGNAHPYEIARKSAEKYLEAIKPYCESQKAVIVGSLRRKYARWKMGENGLTVHDIEFLVIPKTRPIPSLFDNIAASESLLEVNWIKLVRGWNATIIENGPVKKKILLPEGLHLEVNISDDQRWGVEMVIKTGPEDFSKKCVTKRQHNGWLPSYCQIKDGWKVYGSAGNVLSMPDELHFLEFLGLGWIEPEDRK